MIPDISSNGFSADGIRQREFVTVVPAPATPNHCYVQRMTCQSLRKSGADCEQCQSCIERRSDSGGCRFVGFRAFMKHPTRHEDINDHVLPAAITGPKERVPRKRKDAVDTGGISKKRKGYSNAVISLPEGLNYVDYQLVGNRETHLESDSSQGKACLYSVQATSKLAIGLQGLSDVDKYILKKTVNSLGQIIKRELAHEQQTSHPLLMHPIIRIADDPKERSICDSCATTLFIVSYICHTCGREYCPDCYDEWNEDEEQLRFDLCSRNRRHKKEHLVLAVRACENEIAALSAELDTIVKHFAVRCEPKHDVVDSNEVFNSRQISGGEFAPASEVSAKDLDERSFQQIWALQGRPLIIKDCLERFKISWNPQYFIEKHGQERCTLVQSCPPFGAIQSNVGTFFKQFGRQHQHDSLKLKDWPPDDDFADIFPELMQDFEDAIPKGISRYIRRNGLLNLASRFPRNYVRPDLGPKMYNAFSATFQSDGTVGGTTNLHRDITDAINFMMYATTHLEAGKGEDGITNEQPPSSGAVWDIFPTASSSKIRDYLDNKYPGNNPTDPFHRQDCYLSEEDLKVLASEHDIRPYRILQRPGDAVLIPAGCAHQVRNTKDCIKVAVDFLSPENVDVCGYLLQENRRVSERSNTTSSASNKRVKVPTKPSRIKKEDVLQLWKCLMFYYLSIRVQIWGVGEG